MFGAIGAIIFGVVFAGSWMIADDREQAARENAKKRSNYPYYYDKNGKLRNAHTGRKYSTQDALNEIERKRKERLDRWEKRYWGFVKRKIYYDTDRKAWLDIFSGTELELFNNYEDYKKYRDEMFRYYKDKGIDELDIIRFCSGFGKISHFSNNDIDNEVNLNNCKKVNYN